MDNRITKSRLARVLSYDWLKIILIMAAIVFVWALAYTIGAPRISVGQQFDLFVYNCDFTEVTDEGTLLNDAKKSGAFSYDVLEMGSREFTEEYFSTIMSAATSVYEGDVMIMSDFEDDIKNNCSKFRSFTDNYGAIVADYSVLVKNAKDYCLINEFVVKGKNGEYSLNKSAIEVYFKNRMKKDARFRTDEKKAEGVKSEIERIKAVWNNALILENIIENHSDVFVTYRRYGQSLAAASSDQEKKTYQEYYDKCSERLCGVNLGKLTGGEKDIKDLYCKTVYSENVSEGGTPEIESYSADGIVMFVFDYTNEQPDLQYETLGFVNYIFKTYSNFCSGGVQGLIA